MERTITEIAWLAGLLEGEGSFTFHQNDKNKKTPHVKLNMTDRDIIERAKVLMDAKSVYTIEKDNPKHKTTYQIDVAGYRAIEICEIILPFMGIRRSERINELLQWKPVRARYAVRGEVIINKCGHPEAPHHSKKMCMDCYNKNRRAKETLDLDI